jgi:hypothetical protein
VGFSVGLVHSNRIVGDADPRYVIEQERSDAGSDVG